MPAVSQWTSPTGQRISKGILGVIGGLLKNDDVYLSTSVTRQRVSQSVIDRIMGKSQVANARPRKPLSRLDPTRTITLRTAFAREVKRRFARLKGALVKLIVGEDALGLSKRELVSVANSFCPTGPGGGVDPTCSPSKSIKVEYKGELVQIERNPSREGLARWLSKEPMLRGIVNEGDVYIWEPYGHDWEFHHYEMSQALGLQPSPFFEDRFEVRMEDGKPVFKSHGHPVAPALSKAGDRIGVTVNSLVASCSPIIEVPDIRQHDHYSCGAAAAMCVGRYFGVGPTSLTLWKHALGTDVEESTKPSAIETYLRELGLSTVHKFGMTVDDLAAFTQRGWPVICPVQDYGPEVPKGAEFAYGHYLTVIGVILQPKTVANVFCATGEGGGVDPGCSAGESAAVPSHVQMKRDWSGWAKSLQPHHLKTLDDYQAGYYQGEAGGAEGVFGKVREGQPLTVDETNSMLRLGYLMKNAESKRDLVAYRGLGNKETSHYKVGDVVEDKAFMSTSLDRGHVEQSYADPEIQYKPTILKLSVPKGANAAYLDAVGKSLGEKEILLGRGTKYEVTSVSEDKQGRRVVEGNVLLTYKRPTTNELQYTGYVVCQDSSEDNVIAGEGSVQKPGRIMVSVEDWDKIWHDVDVEGNEYNHFGIAVGKIGVTNGARVLKGAKEYDVPSVVSLSSSFPPRDRNAGKALSVNEKKYKEKQVPFKSVDGEYTLVENTRWMFHEDSEKVKAFQLWLKNQLDAYVRGRAEDELWQRYTEAGFRKGAGRAFDDVRQAQQDLPDNRPDLIGAPPQQRLDFYQGTKEEFLRSSFGRPAAVEKVKLLAGRSFDDLKGVTEWMSTTMSRELTDGLVEGKGPREIARDLSKAVDIGRDRALLVARTEIIRAHAEGQLEALEGLGVEEVGVAVEWSTAGEDADPPVCEECQPMEGVVLSIDEAHNMIPMHPNCVAGDSCILADDALAIIKAEYAGEVVELTTASGRRLTVTPNHMLLTEFGFLQAKFIHEGVNVVDASSTNSSFDAPDDDTDDDTDESCISDVFASLSKNPFMLANSVPCSSEDLHGDGESCNSEVSIIWPNRKLWDETRDLTSGKVVEGPFMSLQPRGVTTLLSTRSSVAKFLEGIVRTLDGGVGSLRESHAVLNARHLHSFEHRLTTVSGSETSLQESPVNCSTATLEPFGEGLGTHPFKEQLCDLFRRKGKTVIFDRVTSAVVRHVTNLQIFDVQTQSTLYQVNGILSSNCRCAWIPANVGEDDSEQKSSKREIDKALEEATEAGADLEDKEIDEDRPESILNTLLSRTEGKEFPYSFREIMGGPNVSDPLEEFSAQIANVFCPTGPGGGVDPSCHITVYRGMSKEAYEKIRQTGMLHPEPMNPHNDVTTDLETARYYASEKVHDEPGVVVKFRVPSTHVRPDEVFKGDYKILRPIDMKGHEVVE